jgi:hypothetical protein
MNDTPTDQEIYDSLSEQVKQDIEKLKQIPPSGH